MEHEDAVFELVQKFGYHGIIDGLIHVLANDVNSLPDEDELSEDEPDPSHKWADRLTHLLEASRPYAIALDGGKTHIRERSEHGVSLEIIVKARQP